MPETLRGARRGIARPVPARAEVSLRSTPGGLVGRDSSELIELGLGKSRVAFMRSATTVPDSPSHALTISQTVM
ncbi:MAG: hypothetical protein QOG40_257 [Solirubrobacteraceae bacterium]|nr:hypothetical protein [Solirubrobacteraceae bacterium]